MKFFKNIRNKDDIFDQEYELENFDKDPEYYAKKAAQMSQQNQRPNSRQNSNFSSQQSSNQRSNFGGGNTQQANAGQRPNLGTQQASVGNRAAAGSGNSPALSSNTQKASSFVSKALGKDGGGAGAPKPSGALGASKNSMFNGGAGAPVGTNIAGSKSGSTKDINYYTAEFKSANKDRTHKDNQLSFTDRSTGGTFSLDDPSFKQAKPYKVGIDLGTVNLLVYVDGVGIVFNEPSVIALEYGTNRVIAFGHEAAIMEGRVHSKIRIVKPLHGGVISDLTAAIKLLSNAISKLETINIDLARSTLLICCPSEVTEIEQEAMIELAREIGVIDTFVEEEVKAGAIGADLPIFRPIGSFVIDIGGGSTDIGVLAIGDIVTSDSIRVAGNFLDKEIQSYIQFTHKLLIGKPTAERIKKEIGCLLNYAKDDVKGYIAGRDLITGLPKKIQVTQVEIARIITPQFIEIAKVALGVLQQTPAQLSADIVKLGIVLNGGGALIKGAAEFFADHLKVKVRVSKNPLTAIVEGSRALLKNRGNYLIRPDF